MEELKEKIKSKLIEKFGEKSKTPAYAMIYGDGIMERKSIINDILEVVDSCFKEESQRKNHGNNY